jgi:hypothetical protein
MPARDLNDSSVNLIDQEFTIVRDMVVYFLPLLISGTLTICTRFFTMTYHCMLQIRPEDGY